jgi:hypothetical protein
MPHSKKMTVLKTKDINITERQAKALQHICFCPNRTDTLQKKLQKTVRTIKKSKVTCETVKFIDEINIK